MGFKHFNEVVRQNLEFKTVKFLITLRLFRGSNPYPCGSPIYKKDYYSILFVLIITLKKGFVNRKF